MFQLLGSEHASALAQVLRLVLHQRLFDERLPDHSRQRRLTAEILESSGPSSRVAAILRQGPDHLPQLQNEIQLQRNAFILGRGGLPMAPGSGTFGGGQSGGNRGAAPLQGGGWP